MTANLNGLVPKDAVAVVANLTAVDAVGGETFSLVACSRTNRLPTDLDYRIVSTFRLVEWVDLG